MTEDRKIVQVRDDGDYIDLDLPAGAVPRGTFLGKDRNGADTYEPAFELDIFSVSPSGDKGSFEKVSVITVEQDCPCVEVFAGPYSAIVSTNESLAVFDHKTGQLEKTAPEASIGRFIPVVLKDPCEGTLGDSDIGWFIGMLVSDGWITERCVGLAKLEDAKRERFIRIARTKICDNFTVHEYAGTKGKDKLGDSMKIHLTGKDLPDILHKWGFYDGGTGALHKTIPAEYLFNGSPECLKGILAGLIDGDGSMVCNTTFKNPRYSCKVSTSSKPLVKALKMLMFRLGLRWSLTTTPPRGHSKESYAFCPSTVDVRKILAELDFTGEREREISAMWQDSPPHKDEAVIPITEAEFTDLRKACLAAKRMAPYHGLKNVLYKYVTRALVDNYTDIVREYAPELYKRRHSDIIWTTLDKTEDAGTREVFDFEVPSTKVFMVNGGMIIWDTMSYSVPVSQKAVQEAVEKMMPEKNLLYVRDRGPTYVPSSEYLQGLYLGTRRPKDKAPKVFAGKEEAMQAYRSGEIAVDDPIVIR